MKAQSRKFLFDLLGTPSPSGFEAAGQRKWMAAVGPVADRVESDAYGTAWATRTGAADPAPTVMLEAHADEIGRWYLRSLDTYGGRAARVANKHLDNDLNLGMIALICPGARIVHCLRDPVDNGLSIFMAAIVTDPGGRGPPVAAAAAVLGRPVAAGYVRRPCRLATP